MLKTRLHLSLDQKVAAALMAALLTLAIVGTISYRSLNRLVDAMGSVEQTHRVLRALEGTYAQMVDAEAGSRGYLLTGDERYLESYESSQASVAARIADLRRMLAGDASHQAEIARLERLLDRRFALIRETVARRQAASFPAGLAMVQTGQGKMLTDSIRQVIDVMEATEEAALERRSARERAGVQRVVQAIGFGFFVALMISQLAAFFVHRDVMARERTEEEMRKAREAAEAASRAKSDFLARMSHELRTPLNSVIGFANVLLKNRAGSLSGQELTYLERIQVNGMQLLALINDLLDIAKIEAGRMQLEWVPVALDALIADTTAGFEGQLRDREVTLVTELPQPMAELTTDPAKLLQALTNLIGNALKFTEQGSVTVRVVVDDATRTPLRIDVADTGVGIPGSRRAAIFEAFEQAERGTSRQFGGTGLGLAISRSLCELMGYRLTVESEVGQGSTFSILLSPASVSAGDGAGAGGAETAPAEVQRTQPG